MDVVLKKHILRTCSQIVEHTIPCNQFTDVQALFNHLNVEIGITDFNDFQARFNRIILTSRAGFTVEGNLHQSRIIISTSASSSILMHEWIHYFFDVRFDCQKRDDLYNLLITEHAKTNKAFNDGYSASGTTFTSVRKQKEETIVRLLNGEWYVSTLQNPRLPLSIKMYPWFARARMHFETILLMS